MFVNTVHPMWSINFYTLFYGIQLVVFCWDTLELQSHITRATKEQSSHLTQQEIQVLKMSNYSFQGQNISLRVCFIWVPCLVPKTLSEYLISSAQSDKARRPLTTSHSSLFHLSHIYSPYAGCLCTMWTWYHSLFINCQVWMLDWLITLVALSLSHTHTQTRPATSVWHSFFSVPFILKRFSATLLCSHMGPFPHTCTVGTFLRVFFCSANF